MIARRLGHAPGGGFGMLALEILEDHARKLDVFGFPLGFGKDYPVQGALRTVFEGLREKRLGMPDKSDFAGGEAELFPHQTHQPVTICAAARIAVAAGGEYQADVLEGSRVRRDGACDLIGESLDHQGMRGVDVVVMNAELRIGSPGLSDRMSESLALQQIEIESGGQHEDLSWAVARDCGRQGIDGNQFHCRPETENRLASRGYCTRVPAVEIGGEDERGSQYSFPPIRPCLVMEASTSTIARTATRAVMSEMS